MHSEIPNSNGHIVARSEDRYCQGTVRVLGESNTFNRYCQSQYIEPKENYQSNKSCQIKKKMGGGGSAHSINKQTTKILSKIFHQGVKPIKISV